MRWLLLARHFKEGSSVLRVITSMLTRPNSLKVTGVSLRPSPLTTRWNTFTSILAPSIWFSSMNFSASFTRRLVRRKHSYSWTSLTFIVARMSCQLTKSSTLCPSGTSSTAQTTIQLRRFSPKLNYGTSVSDWIYSQTEKRLTQKLWLGERLNKLRLRLFRGA